MSPDAAAGDCVIGATLQPWSLLGGVSSPQLPPLPSSLYIECPASPPPAFLVPFETSAPSSLLALMIGAVVGRRFAFCTCATTTSASFSLSLFFFTIRERCNDILRPRTYARAAVRERARPPSKKERRKKKNVHDNKKSRSYPAV